MRLALFATAALLAAPLAGLIAPAAVAAEEAKADERRICRSEIRVGTRMRQRTCLTRAEWRQRDLDNREGSRRMLREAGATPQFRPPPNERGD